MPSTARLTDALKTRGNALKNRGETLVSLGRSHRKAVVSAGAAAAALVGVGAATASTMGGAAPALNQASASAPAVQQQPATAHLAVVVKHDTSGPTRKAAPKRKRAVERRTVTTRHAPAAPAKPYTITDSVTPSALPTRGEGATYANGSYAVSPAQVGGKHVLWIDTNGSDPRANVLDVEPGDATPSGAAVWAQAKLDADHNAKAIIYTMRSDWGAAQASVASLPHWMQSHIRWWIADPTGYPHVVPGSSATQWYWGSKVDLSTANPGF